MQAKVIIVCESQIVCEAQIVSEPQFPFRRTINFLQIQTFD